LTRAGKTLATIAAVVALGGTVAGGVAVLLGVGSDLGTVRADVARHERVLGEHRDELRVHDRAIVGVPDRIADLVRRLDEITRRIERLEPRSSP